MSSIPRFSTSQSNSSFSSPIATVPNWVEHMARFGFTAKAVIYGIVGALAVQVAFGEGGSLEGSRGAIGTIAEQPFGRILLGILAFCLLGYVVWRFVQTYYDTEAKGTDAKGIIQRIGYGVSGVIYLGLALWTAAVALGMTSAQSGGDSSKQSMTATLMSMPWGIWLVGIVGGIVLGLAAFQAYVAYHAKFMERYNLSELNANARKYVKWVGQFGIAARAVTFAMMGTFLIVAAAQADPTEVKGLGGSLRTLSQQPYGPWLLVVVALGVVAYAAYCAANARYREFRISNS